MAVARERYSASVITCPGLAHSESSGSDCEVPGSVTMASHVVLSLPYELPMYKVWNGGGLPRGSGVLMTRNKARGTPSLSLARVMWPKSTNHDFHHLIALCCAPSPWRSTDGLFILKSFLLQNASMHIRGD